MDSLKKEQLDMKRKLMPMSQQWHVKQGIKKSKQAFFDPVAFMRNTTEEAMKAVMVNIDNYVIGKQVAR